MTKNRLIAVGDIHGEIKKLNSLLKKLCINKDDTVVFLGDYIDRGPSSKEVVDKLLELSKICHCEFLTGNHEYYLLEAVKGTDWAISYFNDGGKETVKSYGSFENIFKIHSDFYNKLKLYYMTDKYLFLHAGIRPDKPFDKQEKFDMLSIRDFFIDNKHSLKQKIIFGHTPFEKPYVESDKIGIDTGCGRIKNAPLTAIILDEEKFVFSD